MKCSSFYLPADFPAKQVILAQIIAWYTGTQTGKTIDLALNPTRQLKIQGHSGDTSGFTTRTADGLLSNNLALGTWHDVIIYCKFSNNGTGALKAWFNGAPESAPSYSITNINLGSGTFTGANVLDPGGYVKFGMYCWDHQNYTVGETRVAYYDEIAYLIGNPAGAFDSVKPEGYGAVTLYADNFDSQSAGASPAGWTIVNSGSTSTTIRSVPSTTDKSLRCWDDNTTGQTTATRAFTAQTGPFRAGWSFMQNGTGNAHRMFLRSGTTSAVELLTSNGNLAYVNSSGSTVTLQALTANTWYDVDVSLNASTDLATISVNGSVKAANVAFRNPVSSVDQFLVGTSPASTGVHLFIDDILIER